jgi:hypothetical protein
MQGSDFMRNALFGALPFDARRPAFQVTLSGQNSPAFGNGFADKQDTPSNHGRSVSPMIRSGDFSELPRPFHFDSLLLSATL